ncbi:MAG TPA: hypothetical protein PLO67_21350, partial [Saprospiraceae bacterium]|nr:hypothetical protein [Saprospiraceae bacterium]
PVKQFWTIILIICSTFPLRGQSGIFTFDTPGESVEKENRLTAGAVLSKESLVAFGDEAGGLFLCTSLKSKTEKSKLNYTLLPQVRRKLAVHKLYNEGRILLEQSSGSNGFVTSNGDHLISIWNLSGIFEGKDDYKPNGFECSRSDSDDQVTNHFGIVDGNILRPSPYGGIEEVDSYTQEAHDVPYFDNAVRSLHVVPDGKHYAVALSHGRIAVLAYRQKKLKPGEVEAEGVFADTLLASRKVYCPVSTIALAPDCKRVITAHYSSANIFVIDTAKNSVPRILKSRNSGITAISFIDRQRFATVGTDGWLEIWNLSQNTPAKTFFASDNALLSLDVYVSDAGTPSFLAGGLDGRIYLWRDTAASPQIFGEDRGAATSVRFSKNDAAFISCHLTSTLLYWDVANREKPVYSLQHGDTRLGKELISYSIRGDTKYYLRPRRFTEEKELLIRHRTPTAMGFSADGRLLAIAHGNYSATIWEVKTKRLLTELVGHTDLINTIKLSPDGRIAVTCSQDGTVRIWDATTGNLDFVFWENKNMEPLLAEFQPNGRTVRIGYTYDETIYSETDPKFEVDPALLTTVRELEPDRKFTKAPYALSINGKYGALALKYLIFDKTGIQSLGEDAEDWLLADQINRKIVGEFSKHGLPILALEFSPDNRFVFSIDSEGHLLKVNTQTLQVVERSKMR